MSDCLHIKTNNDWTCSGCGRHFNMLVPECPHCKFDDGKTITTSGKVPDIIPATQDVKCREPNDIPSYATGLHCFDIKNGCDGLQAFIGFYVNNSQFHFCQIPYTPNKYSNKLCF